LVLRIEPRASTLKEHMLYSAPPPKPSQRFYNKQLQWGHRVRGTVKHSWEVSWYKTFGEKLILLMKNLSSKTFWCSNFFEWNLKICVQGCSLYNCYTCEHTHTHTHTHTHIPEAIA
jgi:hypothetical protein